jgi:hypothetical protein
LVRRGASVREADQWKGFGGTGRFPECLRCASVHLRPPSIDPGITSFLWAFGLALFIWLGQLAIGISQGTALVVALLSFGGIFLVVRLLGGDDPVR